MNDLLKNFSRWVPWGELAENEATLGLKMPGVYLIGEFRNQTPPNQPLISENIIYIGETCSQTIRKRLYQFNRSAFHGLNGHSGGHTFRYNFKIKTPPKWLFISSMPEEKYEPFSSAKIRYIERALIHSYVQAIKKLPRCNRK